MLPGPVSIANVQKAFDGDGDGRGPDPATEKRIRGVATNLIGYIESNICPRFAPEAMVRGAAELRAGPRPSVAPTGTCPGNVGG